MKVIEVVCFSLFDSLIYSSIGGLRVVARFSLPPPPKALNCSILLTTIRLRAFRTANVAGGSDHFSPLSEHQV